MMIFFPIEKLNIFVVFRFRKLKIFLLQKNDNFSKNEKKLV